MSYERIAENPHYKNLLEHAGVVQASLTASRTEVTRMAEELYNLRASRIEWEENVVVRTTLFLSSFLFLMLP